MTKPKLASIPESVFIFLADLKKHNNREWFNEHKSRYLHAHESMIAFADTVLSEMNRHDTIETATGRKSLFRIYNDLRFAKEKPPYKTNWSGGFSRATKYLRGSYYFHIQEGNSYASGGFYGPNPADLARIRQEIDGNGAQLRSILKKQERLFGKLRGDCLKYAPTGFSVNHPEIDLLRYKQFILRHSFTDKEVRAKDFAKKLSDVFKAMRPFLDFMSETLTTDSNGTPLDHS